MIKPNFKNSIVNVASTLYNFLGNDNSVPKIGVLEKALSKEPKNVVYICLDGLGMFPLKQNLGKDSFLRKHVKKTITSVFPSTTTNATTCLYSAKYPAEHGLFGWSLWFENLGRAVDIYLGKDSITGEKVTDKEYTDYMKFDYFFDSVRTDRKVTAIYPPYVEHQKNNVVHNGMEDMLDKIIKTCQNGEKNLVFAYVGEPDATMHKYGVTSSEAKAVIEKLNALAEKLYKSVGDLCLVITPDHGQTDIRENIELYKDTELFSTLSAPPYVEPRATAFKVKKGQEAKFEKEMKKYNKDAKLFKTADLIKKNYFGKTESERFHMLGDYFAIMKTTDKIFLLNESSPHYKGHHTALTKREMLLPLIIAEKE